MIIKQLFQLCKKAMFMPLAIKQPHPIEKTERLFLEVLKEFINAYSTENNLSEATKRAYEVKFRNIHLYLATKKNQDLKITDIKHRHVDDLFIWLKTELSTANNRYVSRHMDLCKATTKYALKQEYIETDPLTSITGKRDPKRKIITLTAQEVKRWMAYKHSNAKTQLIADIFLFQCFTGLSYGDIWNYGFEEEEGIIFITNGRAKNDNFYSAEFNQYAQAILEKYNGNIPKLPNQPYNEKIKEIADKLNINKHLTTHIGRKTFATLNWKNGYSLGSIGDMLGHKKAQTTKDYYIEISRDRIITERKRLKAPDLLGA